MSAFDVGSDGLAPLDCVEVDMPCGLCGHTGAVHFSGEVPDALTKQTQGCCYHDGEGPCLCSGWIPESPARGANTYAIPRRVIIESPFGKRIDGSTCTPEEIAENLRYFWRCVKDSLARGEAPFGSHGFYPNVLDDATPEQRTQGIEAGFAWARSAELRCFYVDRGVTPGMLLGRADATKNGQRVEMRRIEP